MSEWKQREIKFRAWNKEEGVMGFFNLDSHEGEHGGESSISTNTTAEGHKFAFSIDYREEYPIMQYTGLKDKNGKEIYEGDMARDISGKVAVIVYSPPSFFAQIKGELWDIDKKAEGESVECIEVIGNIFEKPELMED